MKQNREVPYMGVSEGQGHDIPDKKKPDSPWFCRPDPLYFPGYMFPFGVVRGNTIGLYNKLVIRDKDLPTPSL